MSINTRSPHLLVLISFHFVRISYYSEMASFPISIKLVVVGDGQGKVGFGLGKAKEVPEAIRKGTEQAKKNMITVPLKLKQKTIPFDVLGKYGAGRVLLKPAAEGTGVIAGGPVRAVLEAVGIGNILTKCIGTNNPHNVVRATMNALGQLKSYEEIMAQRGILGD